MSGDQLAQILDELQGRLEGPARYAFELVVRQVFIEGAIWTAVGALLLALTLLGASVGWRHWRAARKDQWARWDAVDAHFKSYPSLYGKPTGEADFLVPAAFIALGLTGAAVSLVAIGSGLLRLLNPEYAALERLLTLVVP